MGRATRRCCDRTAPEIVVSDATGLVDKGNKNIFPIGYDVAFVLYAFDRVTNQIAAKVTYSVHIAKASFADTAAVGQLTRT